MPALAKSSGNLEEPRQLTYAQMYEMLNPEKPETDEDRQKREKKEKYEGIFSAIGDAVSALSNLYFTSKGAPNTYNPSSSMSAATKARWDKLKAEREAVRDRYNNGMLNAMMRDKEQDWRQQQSDYQKQRDEKADAMAEAKAKRDEQLAALEMDLKTQQISAAEAKAKQEAVKAQYADALERLEVGYKTAGINQRNASAGASHADANASNAKADYYRNGGGNSNVKATLALEDETKEYHNIPDYESDVMKYAQDYGVPTTTVEVTEWNTRYNPDTKQRENTTPKKQRTVRRPIRDIKADIERKAHERKKSKKKSNPMGEDNPSPSNGKKQNPMS